MDNLQVSCQGTDIHFKKQQLQTAVNHMQRWDVENGFTFSCQQRDLHEDPKIVLGFTKISVQGEDHFLGIVFDNKLTFLPLVRELHKACEKKFNLLKYCISLCIIRGLS